MSLNIQKYAHIKNEALGAQRLPYHKIKVWWVGMVVNAIGEVGNLVAYGYAEATVVTPIGAVGVIFSAVIATFILNEKFARIHAVGIFFIIVGVVLIVYSKGNEKVLASLTLAFRVHTHTPTHTHNTIEGKVPQPYALGVADELGLSKLLECQRRIHCFRATIALMYRLHWHVRTHSVQVIEPTVEEAIHEYFLTAQSVSYLFILAIAGYD